MIAIKLVWYTYKYYWMKRKLKRMHREFIFYNEATKLAGSKFNKLLSEVQGES